MRATPKGSGPLPSNARRHGNAAFRALRAELREAEAHYTRHIQWVAEVKSMGAEQIAEAWETAEPWQRRILAIRALDVDPVLREEFDLLRDPFRNACGNYQQPSAASSRMLAALESKPPYRHPCVISRDIANIMNSGIKRGI